MIGRCHSDVFYILHPAAVLFINVTMLLLTISFTLAPLVYAKGHFIGLIVYDTD